MAVKYDIENFFDDVLVVLRANINTKLAAIDTDKNDGITLETVNTDAYFFQTMATQMANFGVFVYVGVGEIEGDPSPYAYVSQKFSADVVVILSDDGNDPNIMKRLLRYHRALIEIFQTNFDKISKVGKIKISSLSPFPIEVMDRPTLSRGIGVSLEVHLA